MQILIFVFMISPVLACKMTAEGWKRKAEATALAIVSNKAGHKNLRVFPRRNHWIVRTTRLNCEEYKVEIHGGNGGCKASGKILSKKPCP